MSIFSKLFGTKQPKSDQNKKDFATTDEARAYLSGLISTFSDNFTVNSPTHALYAYRTISQLDTVIGTIADSLVNANKVLYKTDKQGKKVAIKQDEKKPELLAIYNLLEKPHFLQSESEYWKTLAINYLLYGITHTFKTYSIGYGYQSMLCLPTVDVIAKVKEKVNYLSAKNLKQIIQCYEINQGEGGTITEKNINKFWTLQRESLTVQNNGYIIPENPLSAIEKTLGTLKVIADIKNELLGNHGAIGIINPDGKDSDGETQTLLPQEKTELQESYKDYGIQKGKYKLLITNTNVKFTAISLPIADLLLNEFEEKAEKTLAAKFGVPVNIFGQQSKYENQEVGQKTMYENTSIPLGKIISTSFNSGFGLKELGAELEFDFSHISFLQKDKKQEAEKNKIEVEYILDINASVATGAISRDTGIQILIAQGMELEQAKLVIGEKIERDETQE